MSSKLVENESDSWALLWYFDFSFFLKILTLNFFNFQFCEDKYQFRSKLCFLRRLWRITYGPGSFIGLSLSFSFHLFENEYQFKSQLCFLRRIWRITNGPGSASVNGNPSPHKLPTTPQTFFSQSPTHNMFHRIEFTQQCRQKQSRNTFPTQTVHQT